MNKFFEIRKDAPIIIDTCIFMVGIEKRQNPYTKSSVLPK